MLINQSDQTQRDGLLLMDKRILACKGADPERIVIKEVAYGVSAQKRATAVYLAAGKYKRAARMQGLPGVELFYNYIWC